MKLQYLKHLVLTVSAAAGVALPIDAFATIDMFLKIDGIKGESTDDKHRGEIDVLAWSWGESTSVNTAGRAGSATGKICIHDLQVTKYIDAATPPLIAAGATGTHFKTAVLLMRKAGSLGSFLSVTLSNVAVSSYATAPTGNDANSPLEKVTLQFDVLDGTYTVLNADGNPSGTPVTWQVYGPSSGNCP
jgi:type VI secretion system secreted protein Hcp